MHDAGWGISWVIGSSNSGPWNVYNNEFYHFSHGPTLPYGGQAGTVSGINIYGNYLHDFNWDSSGCGYHNDGIHIYGQATPVTVSANIHDNIFGGAAGSCLTAHIFQESTTQPGSGGVNIYNNVAYFTDNPVGGTGIFGLGPTNGVGTVNLYNNTIVCSTAGGGPTGLLINVATFNVKNNLLKNCSPALWNEGAASATIDHNAVDQATCSGGGNGCYKGGTGGTNLATGATNLTASYGLGAGSSAIGAGVNLTSLNIAALDFDKAGTSRPSSGVWDAGAYQFIGVCTAPCNGAIVQASLNVVGNLIFGSAPPPLCLMPNPCAYNGVDVVNWTTAPNLGGATNNGATVFDTTFLGSGCQGGVCHNFDGSAFTNAALLSPITRLTDSLSVPGVTNGTFVAGQGGSGVIVATNTNTSLVGFSGNGPEYVCLFNPSTGHCGAIGTGIAIPTSYNNAGGGSASQGEDFGSIFFSLTDPNTLYTFGTSHDVTTPTTVTPYGFTNSTPTYQTTFANGTGWTITPNTSGIQGGGSFAAANVDFSTGMLRIKLTGDGTTLGNIGGEISSNVSFGYGTYEWSMRASSDSATPTGVGANHSGQVSAAFNFFNNSQTEIDAVEIEGQSPNLLEFTNWLTTSANDASTATAAFNPWAGFHLYKFVWTPTSVAYYVDGVFQSVHTSAVPSHIAPVLVNHWGTNSTSFGGLASTATRYLYVNSFKYWTPSSTDGHYTVGYPTTNAPIVDFQYGMPLGANAPNWQAGHQYHYGDYVTHILTAAEMAGGTGLRAPSTVYNLGDIVTVDGTAGKCMYKVTVAGTSSSGAAPAFRSTGCTVNDTLADGATLKWRGTASTAQFVYQNTGADGVLSNASPFQWIQSPTTLSTNTCSMPLNSAVLTCSNAPFAASMVGQTISVAGAGASGAVLYAAILTYTSSTVVSLSFPATTAASSTNASLTGHPDLLSQVVDAHGLLWTNVGPSYVPVIGSQVWTAAGGVSRDTSYPNTSYSGKFGLAASTNSYGANYPNGGYTKYSADQDSGIWAMEYDAVANIYHLLNTGTGIWTKWSCSGGTGYNCSGGSWTPSIVGTLTNIANPAGVTVVPGISTQACPYYIHNQKMSKNGNHEVLTTHVVYTACNPLQNFEVWHPIVSVFPFDALNSLQITFFGLNHWDIGTNKIVAFSPGGWGNGAFISVYDASNASTQANFTTFLKPNVNLIPPPYPQGCHTTAGTNPDCTLADVLDTHLSVSDDNGSDTFPACGTFYNYKTLGPAFNGWQNKEACAPTTPLLSSIPANSVNPIWQFSNDINTHTSITFSTQFSVSEVSQDGNWIFWGTDWNCTLGSSTGSAPTIWSSGTHIGFLAVTAVPANPSSLCGNVWTPAHTYVVGNMINPIEGTGGSSAVDDVFQAIFVSGASGPASSLSGHQPICSGISCFTATAPPTLSAAGGTVCDNALYNGSTQLNTLNPTLPYASSCPNGVVWQDLGLQDGRGDVIAVKTHP